MTFYGNEIDTVLQEVGTELKKSLAIPATYHYSPHPGRRRRATHEVELTWREFSSDDNGKALACAHKIAEELNSAPRPIVTLPAALPPSGHPIQFSSQAVIEDIGLAVVCTYDIGSDSYTLIFSVDYQVEPAKTVLSLEHEAAD